MHIYSIYCITNKINGKVYIGFDSQWPRRQKQHKATYSKKFTKLYNSIRKHGWESFEWTVIYQSWDRDHTLKEMEPFFIKEYNSYNTGYNSTLGGEGIFGHRRVMDAKERERRSQAALGKLKSDSHRASMKNKHVSDTARLNMSNAAKARGGQPRSAKTRAKMSESQKKVTLQHHTCPHCGTSGKGNAIKR